MPDAEPISLLSTALPRIGVDEHTIKVCVLYRVDAFEPQLNHRKILDGLCGVPEDKIRSISSAVDKLDKVGLKQTIMGVFTQRRTAPMT